MSRTLGITRFDLLGDFGRFNWLGNFYIVLSYNMLFAVVTTLCLVRKFTSAIREELLKALGLDKLQLSTSPTDPESGKLSANGHQKTLWKDKRSTRIHTHTHTGAPTHLSTAKGRFQQNCLSAERKRDWKELNKPGQCLMDAANGGWEQFSFMTFHRLRLDGAGTEPEGVKKASITAVTLMLTSIVTVTHTTLFWLLTYCQNSCAGGTTVLFSHCSLSAYGWSRWNYAPSVMEKFSHVSIEHLHFIIVSLWWKWELNRYSIYKCICFYWFKCVNKCFVLFSTNRKQITDRSCNIVWCRS